MWRRHNRHLIVGGGAVVLVLLAAACGGSSSSSTTTTSAEAMQGWANDLCTAANTYVSSLTSLGDTLKNGQLSKDSLDEALDKAKSATKTFGDDIEDLGSPPVADSEAKKTLDTLKDELGKDADTVESALSDVSSPTEALGAVSAVTGALATAGTQVSSAYDELKESDPKGTIQTAFKNAPSCSSLIGS